MPYNGSGDFNLIYNWPADAAAGIDIMASRMETQEDDMASSGFGNCLTRDGQGQATANLPMATFRHTNVGNGVNLTDYAALGQVLAGQINWVVAGGSSDAITATYVPAIGSLTDGQLCFFRATAANSTTTPTFAPNSLTAEVITKEGGAALVAGDIPGALAECIVRYNLANTRWELLNPASAFVPAGSIDTTQLANDAVTTAKLANNAVMLGNMATQADSTILANITGSSAIPAADTLTAIIDHVFSSTQGSILYRGSAAWAALGPGTSGQLLGTLGAGANPQWTTPSMVLLNTVTAQSGTAVFTNSSASIGFVNTFQAGQAVQFTTTGGLPTNFATATTYYVSATGLTGTTFEVAATVGGTPIVAGSAGTGTQTVVTFGLVDLTSLTSTYSQYEIVFENVIPATAAEPFELQVHSGGAFKATGYLTISETSNATSVRPTTFIPLSAGNTTNSDPNNAAPGVSGRIRVYTPSASAIAMWEGQTSYLDGAGAMTVGQMAGCWNTSGVIDGFQVLFASGAITSGTAKVYGIA